MSMDPTALALQEIVDAFDAGLGGDAAAALLQKRHPELVTMLLPVLGDIEQVKLFCQHTPPLNQIAGEEDFGEFLEQFVGELTKPSDEGPEEPPRAAA